ISLVGKLEFENSGDRFTTDVASSYLSSTPARRKLLRQARAFLKSGGEAYGKTEYQKAAERYKQAGRVFGQMGDEWEAGIAQSWVGTCALRIPNIDQALAIFGRLIAFGSRRSYRLLLAQSLNCIADAQASRREFSKSLENAATSEEIF